MPSSRLPVPFESAARAWGFLPLAWRRAWPALLTSAVAITAVIWAPRMAEPARLLLAGLVWIMASGPVWRAAVGRQDAAALAPVRLELRLIGVAALTALFLFVMGLLAAIVWLAFAYAAAASGPGFVAFDIPSWGRSVDGRGRAVMAAVSLACAAGLGWTAIRVSLAAPATVDRGRIQVLASWPLTRARVVEIPAAWMTTLAPPAALSWALVALLSRSPTSVRLPLDAAAGLLVTGLWLPLTVGLMRCLYLDAEAREVRPQTP